MLQFLGQTAIAAACIIALLFILLGIAEALSMGRHDQ